MAIETNFSLLLDALLNCTFSGTLFLKNLQPNPNFGYSSEEPEHIFDPPPIFKNVKTSGKAGSIFQEELLELFHNAVNGIRKEVDSCRNSLAKTRYIIDHQRELNETITAINLKKYQVVLFNPREINYMGQTSYSECEAKLTKAAMSHLVQLILTPLKTMLQAELDFKSYTSKKPSPFVERAIGNNLSNTRYVISEETIYRLYAILFNKVIININESEFAGCFDFSVLPGKKPEYIEYCEVAMVYVLSRMPVEVNDKVADSHFGISQIRRAYSKLKKRKKERKPMLPRLAKLKQEIDDLLPSSRFDRP